jgi:hypothetical protein
VGDDVIVSSTTWTKAAEIYHDDGSRLCLVPLEYQRLMRLARRRRSNFVYGQACLHSLFRTWRGKRRTCRMKVYDFSGCLALQEEAQCTSLSLRRFTMGRCMCGGHVVDKCGDGGCSVVVVDPRRFAKLFCGSRSARRTTTRVSKGAWRADLEIASAAWTDAAYRQKKGAYITASVVREQLATDTPRYSTILLPKFRTSSTSSFRLNHSQILYSHASHQPACCGVPRSPCIRNVRLYTCRQRQGHRWQRNIQQREGLQDSMLLCEEGLGPAVSLADALLKAHADRNPAVVEAAAILRTEDRFSYAHAVSEPETRRRGPWLTFVRMAAAVPRRVVGSHDGRDKKPSKQRPGSNTYLVVRTSVIRQFHVYCAS